MNEQINDHEIQDKFRVLYKKHARTLIVYASKFVDKTTAEDLVQNVFLKVWSKRSFLVWEEGLSTYLYHAVQHACLDYLKHLEIKRNILGKLKIEELNYTDNSASLWQENRYLQVIYREIDNLPEKCRKIFTMSYLEDRKSSDIASLLNISKRTVEAQLYKALKLIQEALRV